MGFNYHSVFLLNDGTVKTVGNNNNGQCGTGNTINQLSLYTIPELNNVKQISCGNGHTVFLMNDGTVKTVGNNYYGQCGVGNTTTPQLSLYTIPGLNNVKQVSCGVYYTVFLMNDGTVKTVGYNGYGQCGTGNTNNLQLSLYTISGLNNVKQVACGSQHTVFLMNDGTVKTVGNNQYGQCGTSNINSPQLSLYTIPNLNNVKQISCGLYHTVFLLNDGTIKTVGYNQYGQCGTGNTTSPQLSLYTIPELNNVKQVSCGYSHTVFLMNNGTVKTVGYNYYGQCGTGNTTSPQLSLYTISGLNNVKQISCGYSHTVFLMNDGTVKTIGNNEYDQCGTGNTNNPQVSLYTISNLTNTKSLFDIYSSLILKYLIQDGSQIKNILNNIINYTDNLPYTADKFNTYGSDNLSQINKSLSELLLNPKYKISLMKKLE